MENFTPFTALAGGALIGLAASLLLLMNGRIAGIGGIAAGLLRPEKREFGWRAAFIGGLIAGPILYGAATGEMMSISVLSPTPLLIAGGLLVGFGSRLGSGCTSGHGVCGIGRFSRRSIMATGTFMVAAFITVFLVRHVLGS